MKRDLKFEIQYLLSLTLVIFGLLSAGKISKSINNWIGLLMVLILAIYFSIFNIMYAFGQSVPFKVNFIEKMNRWANPILLLLSACFAYFVGHTILAVGYDNLLIGADFTSGTWQMVIKYGFPILPVGLMTGILNLFVVGPLNRYSDVNIKVIPSSIRVFHRAEETRPLTIKIENDSEHDIPWQLRLDIPDDITFHSEGEIHRDSFEKDGELSPGRAFRKTFQLSHSATVRRSDLIEINIEFENASRREEVELQLEN